MDNSLQAEAYEMVAPTNRSVVLDFHSGPALDAGETLALDVQSAAYVKDRCREE
jgi:hypothetical protein